MPTIKSTSVKHTNFKQLIDYLHRLEGGKETFTYFHNISNIRSEEVEKIEAAFIKNDIYRKSRSNGVGQYHEILSFHPDDRPALEQNPDILEEFARLYLELRAPNSLAIAVPHDDTAHLHIHFMISANQVGSGKATRLSQQRFKAIRRTLEEYQLKAYPTLEKSYVHSRDKEKYQALRMERTLDPTKQPVKNRGVSQERKQWLRETITQVFASTNNARELKENLAKHHMELYTYRGKVNGVMYKNKKFRFTTLFRHHPELLVVVRSWTQSQNHFLYGKELGVQKELE